MARDEILTKFKDMGEKVDSLSRLWGHFIDEIAQKLYF